MNIQNKYIDLGDLQKQLRQLGERAARSHSRSKHLTLLAFLLSLGTFAFFLSPLGHQLKMQHVVESGTLQVFDQFARPLGYLQAGDVFTVVDRMPFNYVIRVGTVEGWTSISAVDAQTARSLLWHWLLVVALTIIAGAFIVARTSNATAESLYKTMEKMKVEMLTQNNA